MPTATSEEEILTQAYSGGQVNPKATGKDIKDMTPEEVLRTAYSGGKEGVEDKAAAEAKAQAKNQEMAEARKRSGEEYAANPNASSPDSKALKQSKGITYEKEAGPRVSGRAAEKIARLNAEGQAYRNQAQTADRKAQHHMNKRSWMPGVLGDLQTEHHAHKAGKEAARAERYRQIAARRERRIEGVKHRQEMKYKAIDGAKKLPKQAAVGGVHGVATGFKKALSAYNNWETRQIEVMQGMQQPATTAPNEEFDKILQAAYGGGVATQQPEGGREGFTLQNLNNPNSPTRTTGSGSGDKNSLPKVNIPGKKTQNHRAS